MATLVIVCVLIALCLQSVGDSRRSANLTICATRVRSVANLMLSYSLDSKGLFLAVRSDKASDLRSSESIAKYVNQRFTVFGSTEWREMLGPTIESGLRCPSIPRLLHHKLGPGTDYWMTSAAYINPSLLSDSRRIPAYLGAAVQKIDDVVFPSAKAIVFEQYAWHNLRSVPNESFDLLALSPARMRVSATVGFCDGSASRLSPIQFRSSTSLAPWPSGPFAMTVDGVRGRDR